MVEQKWVELGRRAVACKHWHWMPGMKISLEGIESVGTLRVVAVSRCGAPITRDGYGRLTTWSTATIPDLTDPATLGCLLALVREVWKDPGIGTRGACTPNGREWFLNGGHSHGATFRSVSTSRHATEAEALVAALEAAAKSGEAR